MGNDYYAWFLHNKNISKVYEFGGCTTIDSVAIQGGRDDCQITLGELPQWIQGEQSAGSIWTFSKNGMSWKKNSFTEEPIKEMPKHTTPPSHAPSTELTPAKEHH